MSYSLSVQTTQPARHTTMQWSGIRTELVVEGGWVDWIGSLGSHCLGLVSEAAVSGCRRKNRQVYEYGEMRRTCFSQPQMIIVLAYRTELLIEENASPWISTYVVCGASQESVTVDCLLSYYIYQNTIKGNFCVFFFVFSSPLISTSSIPLHFWRCLLKVQLSYYSERVEWE